MEKLASSKIHILEGVQPFFTSLAIDIYFFGQDKKIIVLLLGYALITLTFCENSNDGVRKSGVRILTPEGQIIFILFLFFKFSIQNWISLSLTIFYKSNINKNKCFNIDS